MTFRRFQAGEKDIFDVVNPFGETLQARQTCGQNVLVLIPKDKVVDDRNKVAETPIEGLYISSLLRKEGRPHSMKHVNGCFVVGTIFASPTRSRSCVQLLVF